MNVVPDIVPDIVPDVVPYVVPGIEWQQAFWHTVRSISNVFRHLLFP